ncbi:hypothetical protein [Streptomyces cinereoruber]|uniref:hypothetical protein n=1 Tax=Streptomyces cinereoruber TaxID=67260 RepID=UPI0036567BC9
MIPDEGTLHERLLLAVNTVVDQCWGASPDMVTLVLSEALVADELLAGPAVVHVSGAYLPDVVDLIVCYLATYGTENEGRADDGVTVQLYEALGALATDLAAAHAAIAWSTYESPLLSGPVHDLPDSFPDGPSAAHGTERPQPDRQPGAAARRKAERAKRILNAALETLEALDWTRIDKENAQILRGLKEGDRRKVLWVRTRGIIVIGQGNSAFDTVDRVKDIQGTGVFAGSLQIGSKPKLLSARRQAVLTDIPPEEAEKVSPLFAAYRIDVSMTGASRWVGVSTDSGLSG